MGLFQRIRLEQGAWRQLRVHQPQHRVPVPDKQVMGEGLVVQYPHEVAEFVPIPIERDHAVLRGD